MLPLSLFLLFFSRPFERAKLGPEMENERPVFALSFTCLGRPLALPGPRPLPEAFERHWGGGGASGARGGACVLQWRLESKNMRQRWRERVCDASRSLFFFYLLFASRSAPLLALVERAFYPGSIVHFESCPAESDWTLEVTLAAPSIAFETHRKKTHPFFPPPWKKKPNP